MSDDSTTNNGTDHNDPPQDGIVNDPVDNSQEDDSNMEDTSSSDSSDNGEMAPDTGTEGIDNVVQFVSSGGNTRIRDVPIPRIWSFTARFVYLADEDKVLDLQFASKLSRNAAATLIKSLYSVNGGVNKLVKDGGTVVKNTMCMPDNPPGVVMIGGKPYWNSFDNSVVVKEADDNWANTPLGEAFVEQLMFMFPQGTHDTERNIISWFLAHNMRWPGRKILWAPLLVGPQGDGKTTLLNSVSMVIGDVNCHNLQDAELKSGYTAWAGEKCYVIIEELLMPGNKFGLYEAMKPYITNPKVSNNTKNLSVRDVFNITNPAACSNHSNAIPLTDEDRRYAVLFTRFHDMLITDVKAILTKEQPRLQKLNHLMREPGAGAILLGWAKSIDMSMYGRHDRAPDTNAKTSMIDASKTKDFLWLEQAVDRGVYRGIQKHAVHIGAVRFWSKQMTGQEMSTSAAEVYLNRLGFGIAMKDDKGNVLHAKIRLVHTDRTDTVQERPKGKVMLRLPTATNPDATGLWEGARQGDGYFAYVEAAVALAEAEDKMEDNDNLPY